MLGESRFIAAAHLREQGNSLAAAKFSSLFAYVMRPSRFYATKILSVTLDRGLFITAGAVVIIVGVLTGLVVLSLSEVLRFYAPLFDETTAPTWPRESPRYSAQSGAG